MAGKVLEDQRDRTVSLAASFADKGRRGTAAVNHFLVTLTPTLTHNLTLTLTLTLTVTLTLTLTLTLVLTGTPSLGTCT